MLVFNKEIAQELIAITHKSFPLDEYVFKVKDSSEDNIPFKLFHNNLDEEGELLVIAFLDYSAVIQKINDDKFTILKVNNSQSSVETDKDGIKAYVTSNGTDLNPHSDSISLHGDVQYIKQEKIEKEITVVVYTNNAKTLAFHGVNNFQVTSTGFGFDYTGKSTGVTRHAVFNNLNTAGYSITEGTL